MEEVDKKGWPAICTLSDDWGPEGVARRSGERWLAELLGI